MTSTFSLYWKVKFPFHVIMACYSWANILIIFTLFQYANQDHAVHFKFSRLSEIPKIPTPTQTHLALFEHSVNN